MEERVDARQVAEIARGLDRHLADRSDDINAAHVLGAGSRAIQDIVGQFLLPLHFQPEYPLSGPGVYVGGARADFFGRTDGGRGILVEVERGGVHTNNHDLKDLWKAHLSPEVQHLFLVVPVANWRRDGKVRERPFQRMQPRFEAFFIDRSRWIDLLSLHVFGYGPETSGGVGNGIEPAISLTTTTMPLSMQDDS